MKRRPTHIRSGRLELQRTSDKKSIKCIVHRTFFGESDPYVFFVPNDNKQFPVVSKEVIQYRLKRVFNVTIGHYSVCVIQDAK